jgi:hypothetical protein
LILDFIAELWSLALLQLFSPPVRVHPRESDVAGVEKHSVAADHHLERVPDSRHLDSDKQGGEGRGPEDDVSDEFLSQLEQRTQQVKITLANLEAEKVRIEGLITQLQPIVPHYDALLAAERQLAEANVSIEGDTAADASADQAPDAAPTPTDADHPADESANEGWSGSWNS